MTCWAKEGSLKQVLSWMDWPLERLGLETKMIMPLEEVSWHNYIDLTPQKLQLFPLKFHQDTRRISKLAFVNSTK